PICFPWFGPKADDPKAPMHGFARLMEWRVDATKRIDDQRASIVLALESNDATRKLWPYDFQAKLTVTIGPELEMALEVVNTSREAFTFQEALHTYFAVGDA